MTRTRRGGEQSFRVPHLFTPRAVPSNNSNLIFAFQTFSPNHENADQWFSPSLKKAFQICVDGAHFFLSTAFSRRRSHRMALRDARSRAKPFLHVFIGCDHPRWSSKTARAPSLNALRAVRLGGPSAARQRPSYGQSVLLPQSHMYKQCSTPADVRFSIRTACTYNLSPDLEKHKQGRPSKNNAHQNLKQTPNTFISNHKSPATS